MATQYDPNVSQQAQWDKFNYATETDQIARRRKIAEMLAKQSQESGNYGRMVQNDVGTFYAGDSGLANAAKSIATALMSRHADKKADAKQSALDTITPQMAAKAMEVANYKGEPVQISDEEPTVDPTTGETTLPEVTVTAPKYTKEQIAQAGASLLNGNFGRGAQTQYAADQADAHARGNQQWEWDNAPKKPTELQTVKGDDGKIYMYNPVTGAFQQMTEGGMTPYQQGSLEVERAKLALERKKAEQAAAAGQPRPSDITEYKSIVDNYATNDIGQRFGFGRTTSTILPDMVGKANEAEQREADALQQLTGALRSNARSSKALTGGEMNSATEVNMWIKGQMGDAVKIDKEGRVVPNFDVGKEEYMRRRASLFEKLKNGYRNLSGTDYVIPGTEDKAPPTAAGQPAPRARAGMRGY